MSRAWDGAEGLVGLMGSVSLANGKQGPTAGRGGYYGPPPGASFQPMAAGAQGIPGMDLGDGRYLAQAMPQYVGPANGGGIMPPGGYHNGYQAGAYQRGVGGGFPGQADLSGGGYLPGMNGGGMDGYGACNMGWGGQTIQDASGF